jgi:zinc D-Ala-D-Ala carboxypeptidase
MTPFTKHFSEEELTFSSAALRLGIINKIPDEARFPLVTLFTLIVEPLREEVGVPIHLDSAYRCLELNRAIGSHDDSQHIAGERGAAADLKVTGMKPKEVADKIEAMGLPYDQLIEEYGEEGWCHVSFSSRNRRMRFKLPKEE